MQTVIEIRMKKETTIAISGAILMALGYFIFFNEENGSSSLILLLLSVLGLILRTKFVLTGNMILFFASLALAVFPFLYDSGYWLLPGAALTGYAGFAGLIRWWYNDK
jgi:multisubunit Na+/H+ antiporter MnhG subunit